MLRKLEKVVWYLNDFVKLDQFQMSDFNIFWREMLSVIHSTDQVLLSVVIKSATLIEFKGKLYFMLLLHGFGEITDTFYSTLKLFEDMK